MWRQANVRSTTQRARPRPEPCSFSRRAITGVIPRARSCSAVTVGVVAAVADHAGWPLARSAGTARDSGDGVEQRQQLLDVVAVGAGQAPGERETARVDEEMLLRAGTAPVDRARARFGAPFFAWIWLESTTARDHSSSPAARNLASSSACSRSHTPARCHSSNRRQQVTPEPKPSSAGKCRHAIPVCNTNRIPCNASRSGKRLRPGYRNRRCLLGSNGSTNSHNSSETIHGAAATGTPPSLTTDADGLRHQRAGPFIVKRLLRVFAGSHLARADQSSLHVAAATADAFKGLRGEDPRSSGPHLRYQGGRSWTRTRDLRLIRAAL